MVSIQDAYQYAPPSLMVSIQDAYQYAPLSLMVSLGLTRSAQHLPPYIAFQVHLLSQMNTHRGNDLNMFIGGLAQNLSNFQIAPIPILSVLTCSTSSPHDILKFLRKIIYHNLPIGRDKHDDWVLGGISYRIYVGFLLLYVWPQLIIGSLEIKKNCFAPIETIDERVKKIRSPTCGMVWWLVFAEIYLVVDYLGIT